MYGCRVPAAAHFDSRYAFGGAMIDYDRPDNDPIVAEVRKAREAVAARYNFDLDALFDEMMRRQALHPERYVAPPQPRPVESDQPKKAG
jgi:hypothetical protein